MFRFLRGFCSGKGEEGGERMKKQEHGYGEDAGRGIMRGIEKGLR